MAVETNSTRTQTPRRVAQQVSGKKKENNKQEHDYTHTMAIDIIKLMATFINDDRDARSFAHTSKANLAGMREYEFTGGFKFVQAMEMYYRATLKSTRPFSSANRFGRWRKICLYGLLRLPPDDDDKDAASASSSSSHSVSQPPDDLSIQKTLVHIRDWIVREKLTTRGGGVKVICGLNDHYKTVTQAEWSTIRWALKRVKIEELLIQPQLYPIDTGELRKLAEQLKTWNGIQALNHGWVTIPNDETSVSSNNNMLMLPSSLTHLTLNTDQALNNILLPNGLKRLEFGYDWNMSLNRWPTLPESVETLRIGARFNQPLTGFRLPASLTELNFDVDHIHQNYFNSSLAGCILPSCFRCLVIPDRWNLPINELCQLPSSLESLRFGEYFNQPIENLQLPCSLTSLTFGSQFNQSLDGVKLPDSLTELDMGYLGNFNHPIRGDIFPSGLRSLKLSRNFNQPIRDWQLPSTLTRLHFGSEFDQPIFDLPTDFWPPSLIELEWHHPSFEMMPTSGTSSSFATSRLECTFVRRFDLDRIQSFSVNGRAKVIKAIQIRQDADRQMRSLGGSEKHG